MFVYVWVLIIENRYLSNGVNTSVSEKQKYFSFPRQENLTILDYTYSSLYVTGINAWDS